ncbi:MAG: cytidine deaminase [Rhodocyclales bacterium]|nr:cytidine deaminase [Rhodocyclales bacterium]
MTFRQSSKEATEMVFGIIGPVGCNRELIIDTFEKLAPHYSYKVARIKLSDIIREYCSVPPDDGDQYVRVNTLMTAGSRLRGDTHDNAILAKLAAAEIAKVRTTSKKRVIYVLDSIKHPEEVEELRNIYGMGFYLFAVHSAQKHREHFLRDHCLISDRAKRERLIERDKDEKIGHGQNTREAFHLADFFLTESGNNTKVWNVCERFFDIIFGNPFKTPTFNEYAMYLAFAASIKSADLSRQVGAVIAADTDILSTGANECPRPGGGTYWPSFDASTNLITDAAGGRDYMNNADRNAKEKQAIIDALKLGISGKALTTLLSNIENSGLNDITEYGRVVHAEMDAILGCARRGISTKGTVLYCSTYPCHNCAKHIIASGIGQVIYVEPYPKSKAQDMHKDAIAVPDDNSQGQKVLFSPFVGVGPRIFADVFSLTLSAGEKLRRKKKDSCEKAEWEKSRARPRMKIFDSSYVQNEKTVSKEALQKVRSIPAVVVERFKDELCGTENAAVQARRSLTTGNRKPRRVKAVTNRK